MLGFWVASGAILSILRNDLILVTGLCPDPRFVTAAPGGFRRIPGLEKGNGPLLWYRLILPIRFDILVRQAPLPAFLKRAGVTQG